VIDGIDPWPDWSISSPFFPSYLAHLMQTVNHQGRSMQIYSTEYAEGFVLLLVQSP
jgi:hypothetical protein